MTNRERVFNAIKGKPVDRPAVQYLYTPVGFYEHGEKLNDLYARYPGDFEPFERRPIPVLPPEAFDEEGRYFERITDEWGVTQEYRVFGIMGRAVDFPVKDLAHAGAYAFPPMPLCVSDPAAYKQKLSENKKNHFALGNGGGILERMWAIRGFENLMMDLYEDSAEINSLMDRLADYHRIQIEAQVAAGVDGIAFGDDYGTQTGLLLSKDIFRHAIKPRLARMMEAPRKAGIPIHFHSCGRVLDLFDDFKDLGISSLWPQLPVYDLRELRNALQFYGFSIAIHTDRAVTMTSGTPGDVREKVGLENEIFKPRDGGAWFYLEADTGFPFENIKTLVEAVFNS
jgi:uroporphyrinogen decarboxylase